MSASLPPLDAVDLAESLVAIPSVSGAEHAVVAHLDHLLASRGWTTARIPLGDGRENLWATAHAAPEVVLSTHVDTVPPFIAPRRADGRLHGRGSCDAKGIAAAMICAAERLRERQAPVALLFVVGEETAHDGAHAANEWAGRPASIRALVNGEPTESTLALGTKGALRAIVRTAGERADVHRGVAEQRIGRPLQRVELPEQADERGGRRVPEVRVGGVGGDAGGAHDRPQRALGA
jgi:acetylornithine deacetylase